MELIENYVEIDDKKYYFLPLHLAIRFAAEINFSFYIEINKSKRVMLEHDDDDLINKLKNYLKKGLREILVSEADYMNFLSEVKNNLEHKFFDPASFKDDESNILTLNDAYEMVKKSFQDMGVSPQAIDLAIVVNKRSIQVMKSSSNIFRIFKQFKNKCNGEFLNAIFVSFTTSCMIDRYYWQSEKVKK
ncbi:MAG: hypothetical protein HN509_16570 [Halobacteriovoraceae bacterium]|nr:hypothetical protein [Halobacteriovoraceae bacterium]MBT5092817.1 hypothetical protein [Halobacteriovoraceae bacterium]